jgi:hypothetical protein
VRRFTKHVEAAVSAGGIDLQDIGALSNKKFDTVKRIEETGFHQQRLLKEENGINEEERERERESGER